MIGLEGFIAALRDHAADPETDSGLVVYTVVPVVGALAGQAVRTGVGVDEVAPWPVTPPHWIHLAVGVAFSATNVGGSPKAGWRAHSRDIKGWGVAAAPAAAWLAHVRGVLGGAV
ncbi:hypothetical protein [Amycolatopsis sp. cmx-4-68]|uniref:hypothetical protein n=1 Tax=Amycolatopsis sp. cmx-4-68 TaxID=2790938 RepID=UPI00397B9ECD